jgi:hypothetical protein
MDDMEKVKKALYMFVDLFGLDRFDYETLVRFTITVKKNYRQVRVKTRAEAHPTTSVFKYIQLERLRFSRLKRFSKKKKRWYFCCA